MNDTFEVNHIIKLLERTSKFGNSMFGQIREAPRGTFNEIITNLNMAQLLAVLQKVCDHPFEQEWAFNIEDIFDAEGSPRTTRFAFISQRDMVAFRMLVGETLPL